MLLVDADQSEVDNGREDRRAGAHDHRCIARRDASSSVALLGWREPGVEHRHPIAEALPKPMLGLRRESDLGNEHDRAATAFERACASAEVDLCLPAPGRTRQQERTAGLERPLDCVQRLGLTSCECGELHDGLPCAPRGAHAGFRGDIRRPLPQVFAPARLALVGCDEPERAGRRRCVVVGDPERKIDEHRRNSADDVFDGHRRDSVGRSFDQLGDDAAPARATERNAHNRALDESVAQVGERPRKLPSGHEWVDRRVAAHDH